MKGIPPGIKTAFSFSIDWLDVQYMNLENFLGERLLNGSSEQMNIEQGILNVEVFREGYRDIY